MPSPIKTNSVLIQAEELEHYTLVTVQNFKLSYNSIISALAYGFNDMKECLRRHFSAEFFFFLSS